MHGLLTNHHSSMLRTLTGRLIANTKDYVVVRPLQILFPRKRYEQKLNRMRSLPVHTVGNDLARMLDEKGLKLIPGFERHDLNHLILGYGMEPEEELCMQAYLVGDGYYKLHCCLFLSSGLLLPCLWKTLFAHYKLGKRSESLSSLSLEACITERTEFVIRKYRAASANETCSEFLDCQQYFGSTVVSRLCTRIRNRVLAVVAFPLMLGNLCRSSLHLETR